MIIRISILFLVMILSGCANDYYGLTSEIKKDLYSDSKSDKLAKEGARLAYRSKASTLSILQETGMHSFLKDTSQSKESFDQAIALYKKYDEESKLRNITDTAISSTILNDNIIQYQGSFYEWMLLHYYQSMNYLSEKNLDAAMVEVRAASDVQNYSASSKSKRADAYQRALAKKLESKKVNTNELTKQLKLMEGNKYNYSKNNPNNFSNAHIYYYSGVMREISGDSNGALVDYKRSYNLMPNHYNALAAYRLSSKFDSSFSSSLLEVYPDLRNQQYQYSPKTHGRAVVIVEEGLMAPLQAAGVSLYSGVSRGFINVALPYYKKPRPFQPKKIIMNNLKGKGFAYPTQLSGNIYNMALSKLMDDYPKILLRQITRNATNLYISDSLDHDPVLGTVFSVFTLANNQADLRSWSTLPSYSSIADITSKSGIKKLKLEGKDILDGQVINVNEVAIIYVYTIGSRIITSKVLYHGSL